MKPPSEKIACACGCGQPFAPTRAWNKFAPGHRKKFWHRVSAVQRSAAEALALQFAASAMRVEEASRAIRSAASSLEALRKSIEEGKPGNKKTSGDSGELKAGSVALSATLSAAASREAGAEIKKNFGRKHE